MATYTDLRIFAGTNEIKLPAGAWRFIQCSINPISEATQTARAIDGSIVNLGDASFRAYSVELSCSDQRVPPLAGIWPGQTLTIHAPMTLSQPGPVAYLEREPVPGSIRAINAAGQVIASPTGRTVNVPGAVSIEYRPILNCMVISRSGDSTEFKAAAGWSLSLEEVGEKYEEETSPSVSFAAFDLPDVPFGGSVLLDLKTLVSTSGTVGVSALIWEISGGALPAGVTLSASGILSGTPTVPGVYDFTITARAPDAFADQTFVIRAAAPTIALAPHTFAPQILGSAVSFDFKTLLTLTGINASQVSFSVGSGALPGGLTLSAAGVLSGTLTGPAALSSFEVVASHAFATARRVYSLTANAPTITLAPQTFPTIESGQTFSFDFKTITSVSGVAVSALTYSVGGGSLPPGLTLSASGVLSGTATGSLNRYCFEIVATSTYGSGRRLYELIVNPNQVEQPDPVFTATGGVIEDYIIGGQSYREHRFNASGSFNVSVGGLADLLIVAGGGGGGSSAANGGGGAGGGAGGVILLRDVELKAGAHSIVVGAGGAGSGTANGARGTESRIQQPSGDVLSTLGGGGGSGAGTVAISAGQFGASGGGGFGNTTQGFFSGQGNAGGARAASTQRSGGGGAGGAGQNADATVPDAAGGIGRLISGFSAADFYVAGGGGNPGGIGGGGNRGAAGATAGGQNTGGGGGASNITAGLAGGSGLVIIRYKRS